MSNPDRTATLEKVEVTVNYLSDPPVENPRRWLQYWTYDKSRNNIRLEPYVVSIHDARSIADQLDFDKEGFRLVPHHSAVSDLKDPKELSEKQPAELEALVREHTGAARAFCIGPQRRLAESMPDSERTLDATQGLDTFPARFVHGDFTDEGVHWMSDGLPVRLDDYPRYAVFNVWRCITPPPQDIPLAFCAGNTIDEGDAVEAMAVMDRPELAPQVIRALSEAYRPNPRHRWYYFRDMTPDEVVIFKTYDSDRSRCRAVAHTAFTAPDCPPGTAPRQSLEARVVAVFDS
jgi:hypothetical protein